MFTQSLILLSLAVVSPWVTNLVQCLWKSSLINYCLQFALFKKLFLGFFLWQAFQLWWSVTHLLRYYQFMVGKVSRMRCPRAYKSSVSEYKTWALRFCHGTSFNERQWLLERSCTQRSNWMCHAGGLHIFGRFGLEQTINVSKLKAILRTLSSAMSIS